ncbi:hypothetical protein [Lebetimonas sp. JH292]|nr:hypothetical protein [Lebetimonas sp. JH292]
MKKLISIIIFANFALAINWNTIVGVFKKTVKTISYTPESL